jgi:hypothetical protein
MTAVLADRVLLDLIERLETTAADLNTASVFATPPAELCALTAGASAALHEAAEYLTSLREQRLRPSTNVGQAVATLRRDVVRRTRRRRRPPDTECTCDICRSQD